MEINTLFKRLRDYPYGKEWVEFKENWYEPAELGQYISAPTISWDRITL